MRTTYLIEINKNVSGYYVKYSNAKEALKKINNPDAFILTLKGFYFGEGVHKFKTYFRNNEFTRETI